MIQINWLTSSNKFLAVLAVLFSGNATAQLLHDYKAAYPDYNEIILSNVQSYTFSIEDMKLKVIQDNHHESMILSEHGIQNNQESFSYSELVKLNNYDAYSLLTTNGKEKKIKVTQSNEKQARQDAIFYNDVKERQLIFPNLETGAKKVYNYQTEFVDPFLLHKFVFGDYLPVENSTLELVVGKDINIGYKIFNDESNSVVFTQSERKGKRVYTWSMKSIKPVKLEDNSPGYLHVIPHIDVYVKDYTIDNRNVKVLDNVDMLYNYYKGFIKELNKVEDLALKEKSIELASLGQTEKDKLRHIFYWVKDNIKYIAFENGYEGFIPREASLVYERKFGDCKDMTSLITSMANYAGIKNVMISWIGTREIPYSYEQLSTPAVDNHMIAVYKDENGQYIFLDATDKQTRFGLPTSFIQGKEALINENNQHHVVKVPIVAAEENGAKEVVDMTIKDMKLHGSGKAEYFGFSRTNILSQIGDASKKTRFEMIKSLVVKGNNKFNLIDYSEANIADRDKPYVVNFNFSLDSYIVQVEQEMYINMFLERPFEKLVIEKNRHAKYDFEYLTSTSNQFNLEIPQGYKVSSIPEDYILENAVMHVSFKYKTTDNKITLQSIVKNKKLLLEKSDFDLWNDTVKQLRNNYTKTITLSKI
ncbi:MAG TPA: DUF3857 domain-containing protein [Flavobacterium sp.]|nr:DUF3857 domain-containing protein [Flavobacterium sp.]